MDRIEYEGLKPYATTQKQAERLRAIYETGVCEAARREGVANNAISQSLDQIKKKAAKGGYCPDEKLAGLAAPGFTVKRRSTYYDLETGQPLREWLITEPERQRNWESIVAEMQDSLPSIPPLKTSTPKQTDKDLLAVYPYGDPHVGLYCWHEDSEADFDLDESVRLMTEATQSLVGSAPACETALIAFLGDFFHSDDQSNRTRRSGHQLDVDSRWAKVLRVGCKTAATLVGLALQKHKTVHVICCIGNHDDHTAVMLAVYLDALFSGNKRVSVDLSPARFHYFRFGQNFIGIHHGDLVKPDKLPSVMAADRPEDWGQTKYRRWLTGHIHSQKRWDLAGCEVESFRILPPRDVYAESNGYRSARSMDCILMHRERGEVGRFTVRPEFL